MQPGYHCGMQAGMLPGYRRRMQAEDAGGDAAAVSMPEVPILDSANRSRWPQHTAGPVTLAPCPVHRRLPGLDAEDSLSPGT